MKYLFDMYLDKIVDVILAVYTHTHMMYTVWSVSFMRLRNVFVADSMEWIDIWQNDAKDGKFETEYYVHCNDLQPKTYTDCAKHTERWMDAWMDGVMSNEHSLYNCPCIATMFARLRSISLRIIWW